jgi:hypothetical protein
MRPSKNTLIGLAKRLHLAYYPSWSTPQDGAHRNNNNLPQKYLG